jgi:hypothetical protein
MILPDLRERLERARLRRRAPIPGWPASLAAIDVDVLDAAHRHLLRRYATILAHSMSLPFFVGRLFPPSSSLLSPGGIGRYWAWRPLVRQFVEAHIDRRLGQLDRIYLYVHDFTAGEGALATWIEQNRPDLADHKGHLHPWTSWTSLARLLAVPALGAAVGLLGSISGGTLAAIIGWGLSLTIYVPLIGGSSFAHKRWLFLDEPRVFLEADEDVNTYRAEDELWHVLGLRKTPEPALDLIFLAVPFLAYGSVGVASNLVQGRVVPAILLAVLIPPGIAFVRAIAFREWR